MSRDISRERGLWAQSLLFSFAQWRNNQMFWELGWEKLQQKKTGKVLIQKTYQPAQTRILKHRLAKTKHQTFETSWIFSESILVKLPKKSNQVAKRGFAPQKKKAEAFTFRWKFHH